MDKVQPLTRPITEDDALSLNYWLSKFVQEVAKCFKDPCPPKTLYQIVCGIRRFMVEKNPAIEFNPLLFTQKLRELALLERGLFDILKLKEIAFNFSLFFIKFAILRRILGAEMRDGTRAGVCLKARQKEKEPVTDEEEGQLWQSGVFGMETAKSLLNVVYYYNGKLFDLRGGEHRRICLKNFEIGDNYIRFVENVSKTFHVGLLDLKYEPHVVRRVCYSVREHHEPCLIEYYLLYISLEQNFALKKLMHSISGLTRKEFDSTNYLWALIRLIVYFPICARLPE